MHFMPDTEDEDSAAETFWPEGYKQLIRDNVALLIKDELISKKSFETVYQRGYQEKYPVYTYFLEKLADMTAIGAENGADNAFDEIIDSFLTEAPLPGLRAYAHYFWPVTAISRLTDRINKIIVDEYSSDNVYIHAYKVGYQKTFPTFDDYMSRVAELIKIGVMNGANDTIEKIYRSFMKLTPLVPVRRHPRRLKMW
jgi:hypothetical protein